MGWQRIFKIRFVILFVCLVLASLKADAFSSQTKNQNPRKVDEIGDEKHLYFGTFGDVRCDGVIAQLDQLAIGLQNKPTFRGYIIVYAGRVKFKDEARKRGGTMRDFLVKYRSIDAQRIVALDGGYRAQLSIELWLVQEGENPPTLVPTVRPQDVKIKKGKIKYGCPY